MKDFITVSAFGDTPMEAICKVALIMAIGGDANNA